MELTKTFTQDDFTGSLSKINQDKFEQLLDILDENILEEIEESADSVLKAIDADKIVTPNKPTTVPPNVIKLFKELSLSGKFSVGCYMFVKDWYTSFDNEDVNLKDAEEVKEDKTKKSPPKKKAEEVKEKINKLSEEPVAVMGDEEEEEEEEEQSEPEEIKKEESAGKKPKLKAGEKVKQKEEKTKPETKKKPTPKKKKKEAKKDNDLLSTDPKNIEIYDITPETHPKMFLEFEGDYISKRVTTAKNWKPNHPIDNPIPNDLLRDIINAFMDRFMEYEDVMKMVDQMTCAYTSYTAKRIWWMVKYNELLRYSLVKETRGYGGEAYRLIQRWVSHPMVSFALEEWNKVNKKK